MWVGVLSPRVPGGECCPWRAGASLGAWALARGVVSLWDLVHGGIHGGVWALEGACR